MEINDLSDKKFNGQKMLTKVRRPMHDKGRISIMRQKILKSTKQKSELKNTITEMKKSIEQTR